MSLHPWTTLGACQGLGRALACLMPRWSSLPGAEHWGLKGLRKAAGEMGAS